MLCHHQLGPRHQPGNTANDQGLATTVVYIIALKFIVRTETLGIQEFECLCPSLFSLSSMFSVSYQPDTAVSDTIWEWHFCGVLSSDTIEVWLSNGKNKGLWCYSTVGLSAGRSWFRCRPSKVFQQDKLEIYRSRLFTVFEIDSSSSSVAYPLLWFITCMFGICLADGSSLSRDWLYGYRQSGREGIVLIAFCISFTLLCKW